MDALVTEAQNAVNKDEEATIYNSTTHLCGKKSNKNVLALLRSDKEKTNVLVVFSSDKEQEERLVEHI